MAKGEQKGFAIRYLFQQKTHEGKGTEWRFILRGNIKTNICILLPSRVLAYDIYFFIYYIKKTNKKTARHVEFSLEIYRLSLKIYRF